MQVYHMLKANKTSSPNKGIHHNQSSTSNYGSALGTAPNDPVSRMHTNTPSNHPSNINLQNIEEFNLHLNYDIRSDSLT
jgi:hypothetical protein